MMNLCRICLSTTTDKDIRQLKTSKNDDSKSYKDILSFCLDIQVTEEMKITTKLCHKCFRKILSYHKFKTVALRNDTYLKTVNLNCTVKLETPRKGSEECPIFYDPISTNDNDSIWSENNFSSEIQENDFCIHNIKDEPEIKIENDTNDDQSADDLLSVIKKIKDSITDPKISYDENFTLLKEEDSMQDISFIENNLLKAPAAKKRGRPKIIKSEKSKDKKQICVECGLSVWDIKQHSLRHLPTEERKRIKCKVCDKTFGSYGSRNKHNRIKHLGFKYKCDICRKEVVCLSSHKLRVHNPELLKFPCVLCGKRFLSKSLLETHMHQHTKDKPFECDICQKTFRSKIVMLHHKRQVHDKEKSHLCQYCSKSFFKKDHLQIHIRSHTKEKPYKCEECGRSFSSRSTYKNHKETHNTEKNFQCDHCDMKFVRRDYLRTHMICHSKEKRYPCKYCGVRFGRSDHRKRHQYTAHEKHILAATELASDR